MRCTFPSNCAPLDIFYSCSLQPSICTLLTCSSTSLKPPYRNFLVLPLCWAALLLLPSLPDILWGTWDPQCPWEWKHGLLRGRHLGTGAHTHCDPLPWLGPLLMRHPFRGPWHTHGQDPLGSMQTHLTPSPLILSPSQHSLFLPSHTENRGATYPASPSPCQCPGWGKSS